MRPDAITWQQARASPIAVTPSQFGQALIAHPLEAFDDAAWLQNLIGRQALAAGLQEDVVVQLKQIGAVHAETQEALFQGALDLSRDIAGIRPQRVEIVPAARNNLVGIALVTHIPNEQIFGSIKNLMKSHGKIHNT